MKKWIVLLLSLLMLLAFSACGGDAAPADEEVLTETDEVMGDEEVMEEEPAEDEELAAEEEPAEETGEEEGEAAAEAGDDSAFWQEAAEDLMANYNAALLGSNNADAAVVYIATPDVATFAATNTSNQTYVVYGPYTEDASQIVISDEVKGDFVIDIVSMDENQIVMAVDGEELTMEAIDIDTAVAAWMGMTAKL